MIKLEGYLVTLDFGAYKKLIKSDGEDYLGVLIFSGKR